MTLRVHVCFFMHIKDSISHLFHLRKKTMRRIEFVSFFFISMRRHYKCVMVHRYVYVILPHLLHFLKPLFLVIFFSFGTVWLCIIPLSFHSECADIQFQFYFFCFDCAEIYSNDFQYDANLMHHIRKKATFTTHKPYWKY